MGIVAEAVPGEGDPAAVVKQLTGVEVPSYYNPNAINPLKYAEGVRSYCLKIFLISDINRVVHLDRNTV